MTQYYKCDVCGRTKDENTARKEDWHIVTAEPFNKEKFWSDVTVRHYCWRCWMYYCLAMDYADKEYLKIKGTDQDIYANEKE